MADEAWGSHLAFLSVHLLALPCLPQEWSFWVQEPQQGRTTLHLAPEGAFKTFSNATSYLNLPYMSEQLHLHRISSGKEIAQIPKLMRCSYESRAAASVKGGVSGES